MRVPSEMVEKALRAAKKSDYWAVVHNFEAALIRRAVVEARGNRSLAARNLRLDRITLIRKIREYDIKGIPPAKRGPSCRRCGA